MQPRRIRIGARSGVRVKRNLSAAAGTISYFERSLIRSATG